MKRASICPLLVAAAAAFVVFLAFSATPAEADLTVPTDYVLIQDALDAAFTDETVWVEPGTYQETFTMRDRVFLIGIETARTFLDGSGGVDPIITVTGAVGGAISNFTFINASVGILVADNSGSMAISNNVFEVGQANTAISVQNAAATTILNNTFYNNGTAIYRDEDIPVNSNIFANSLITAITGTSVDALIAYNDFFNNVDTGPTGTNSVSVNPLFVDTVNHDFHLKENSPCIDAGDPDLSADFDVTRNDIGAYGGQFADPFPFPVSGLAIGITTSDSIELSWLPNLSYLVTNSITTPGSYNVYYGYAPRDYTGNDPDTGQSPLSAGTSTTFTLSSLNTGSAIPPAPPVLEQVVPGNSQLVLSWTAVPHATGYKVHYGLFMDENPPIDVGNATTYRLTGLTNGQSYVVAISAYAPATYYISVTALDNITPLPNESAFSSEVVAQIGPPQDGGLSGEMTASPDLAAGYPLLKGTKNGCFIATAAYGSYSAPEVLALRSFRDRYLLATAPGRLFVRTYYRYSPAAAALLNAHPAFKPLVRGALMPVVGAAMFLTKTSPAAKAAVLLLAGCGLLLVLVSKRRRQVP